MGVTWTEGEHLLLLIIQMGFRQRTWAGKANIFDQCRGLDSSSRTSAALSARWRIIQHGPIWMRDYRTQRALLDVGFLSLKGNLADFSVSSILFSDDD